MRFISKSNRWIQVPVTYEFSHPLTNQRMVSKVGVCFAPSFEDLKDAVLKNQRLISLETAIDFKTYGGI